MSSLKYWIWLSSVTGFGLITKNRLLAHFDTPENIYLAGINDYYEVEGIKRADITKLQSKNLDETNKILAACEQTGCRVITLHDSSYPERLRNIYDPPILLYLKGNMPEIDERPVVAVVGTRNCTPYGISAAEKMGYQLAKHGLTVVTGLARGVDTAASRGALRAGGTVIGVVGTGLDIVYPPENRDIFSSVINAGVLLSEYPPGIPALPAHFPARNRILSGLSLGVAVIEAPKRSGALITAERALEQGRDVFALPGNVDARSCEGSNALLREGAILILGATDIISEYADLFPDIIVPEDDEHPSDGDKDRQETGKSPESFGLANDNMKKEIDNINNEYYIDLDKILSSLDNDESLVAKAIGRAKLHVDEISVASGLVVQRVLTALTMLEIKGLVVRDVSGKWKLEESV